MEANSMGNYFEDFEAGQVIKHQVAKTIFESDNNLFSLLTMNHHPLHLDRDFAEKSQHGQILVVGTLVFSIAVGLTVSDISGKAIANLEYEKVEHLAGVFINDTLSAETEVLEVRPSQSNPDRGIIYVETMVYNQHRKAVLRFRRKVLIAKRGE